MEAPPILSDGLRDDVACRRCGGQTAFDPNSGHLTCQSCRAAYDLSFFDRDAEARREQGFDPDGPWPERAVVAHGQIRTCKSCGGQVVFVGHALSEHCPYCHGPVVARDQEMAYPTTSLIPFSIDRDTALDAAHAWIKSRTAQPFDLSDRVGEGELMGLYVPFWTFDTTEDAKYWVTLPPNPEAEQYDLNSLHPIKDDIRIELDDLLVPASSHITPLIRDGILRGFKSTMLRAFRPGYLAGFAAERHHQTVAEGLAASKQDRTVMINARIRQALWLPDTSRVSHRAETSNVRYRRILLPVWILHYRYGRATYRVAVSGIDGSTFGERPYSRAIIYGVSGLITALVMGLGMALTGL